MIRFLSLLLCMAFLSGCSTFQPNVADLMQAPKMEEDQAEIYEALTSAAGVSDVQLKYPKTGSYRSAFVMFDLDADGQEEALVFYKMPGWDGNVRIMVLDRLEAGWVSVYDAVGEGAEVLEVDFRVLTSSGRYNLLVGWEQSAGEETNISVYDYDSNRLKVLFESSYRQMLIEDIDGDGIQEMILAIFRESADNASIRLINETDEGLQSVSREFLESSITGFLGVQIGQLAPGQTAVFVDANLGGDWVATEIMAYTGSGRLRSLNARCPQLNRLLTRNVPTRCEDIDGDGILDIPASLPEEDGLFEDEGPRERDERQEVQQYLRLTDSMMLAKLDVDDPLAEESLDFLFEPVWTGFVNGDYSFRFQFPQEWIGLVAVSPQSERKEWTITFETEGALPLPLVSLRVYEQSEPRDVFDNAAYESLKKRGVYEYYGALGQSPQIPEEMGLTKRQLRDLFSLY